MNHTFELIPLTVQTRGEVISSNVEEFRDLVRGALSRINLDLRSDEEFGQAELDVRALRGAEDAVKAAKEKALADAQQLQALFLTLDETAEEIRSPRLELEKLIAKRKEEVKNEIFTEALGRLDCAPRLRAGTFGNGLKEALKGKRTLDTMRKALDVLVITHNAMIAKSRSALESFVAEHGPELVMDREELEVRTPDAVDAELRRRLDLKIAQDTGKRLAAEAEQAKVEVANMKREAAEAAKPPLPPIGVSATPRSASKPVTLELGVSAEWEAFKAKVIAAFAPVKEARAELQSPENIAKAAAFAEAVGWAWKEVA